jgi:hypothetical protein
VGEGDGDERKGKRERGGCRPGFLAQAMHLPIISQQYSPVKLSV